MRADVLQLMADILFNVLEGIKKRGRDGRGSSAILHSVAQILFGSMHQAATRVVDDHDLFGVQQVMRDDQGAQGIFGNDAACVSNDVSVSGFRTQSLKTGDAQITRNAGGIVTEDTLRSLVVSHYLLDTKEFMVINHTDCGLMHTTEQDLRNRVQNRTGTAAISPAFFYAFQNIEENVRHQLQKLRTHPWIPKAVTVRGFVYDVTSGRLREIEGG